MILRAALVVALFGLVVGCQSLPSRPAASTPGAAPEAVDEPVEPVERPPPTAPKPHEPPAEATADAGPPPRIADGGVLFERLSALLAPPVCVRGDHNRQWRRRYAGHPDAFERQLREALPLLGYVVEAVEARGLPGEFVLIPIVESGYRPDARGPGGPTGLWQMIGSTARNHGVHVGPGYDGRLSPVDSTDAALDYLAVLHAEFGDWRATAMAYNAGEGRVRRAIARDGSQRVSGERRLPTGLSGVTYAYVAKLHALACLVAEPGRHGLSLPTDAFTPLERRSAPPGMNRLDDVARQWGTDSATLARWNPAYRHGLAAAGSPRRLLVPSPPGTTSSATAPARPSDNGAAPPPPPRLHTVRRGDTLWAIARRYATTVRDIAAANGLRADRPLRVGARLAIPR